MVLLLRSPSDPREVEHCDEGSDGIPPPSPPLQPALELTTSDGRDTREWMEKDGMVVSPPLPSAFQLTARTYDGTSISGFHVESWISNAKGPQSRQIIIVHKNGTITSVYNPSE